MTKKLPWDEIIRLRDEDGLSYYQLSELDGRHPTTIERGYKREKKKLEGGTTPTSKGEGDTTTRPQVEADGMSQEDMQALKELVGWWRLRKLVEEEHRKSDVATTTTRQRTRRNVYLPDDLWDKLKEQANHELRSISDLVREAVRLYLGA